MKIYTKTGDDGTTSLFDGTRVLKHDARVELYGDVDELNSVVGAAVSFCGSALLKSRLQKVQQDLFALGANLANPKHLKQKDKSNFSEEFVLRLESEIDEMESQLKPMKNFILPGGTECSAFLHQARTICRRAERKLVEFSQNEMTDPTFLHYLNRLSDYLFVAARFANHTANQSDIEWT